MLTGVVLAVLFAIWGPLQDLPLLTALTFPRLERVDGQFLLQAVGLRVRQLRHHF